MQCVHRVPMRGGNHDDRRAGRFRRRDASGRILEHETVCSWSTEAGGGQEEAVRGWLAARYILGGHHDGRQRKARSFQAPDCKGPRCGCHEGPAIKGNGSEKRDRTGNALDPLNVGDLEAGYGSGLPIGVQIGSAKPADRLGGLNAVDRGQERAGLNPVAQGPGGPGPLGGCDGREDGAVHVDEEGGELALKWGRGHGLEGNCLATHEAECGQRPGSGAQSRKRSAAGCGPRNPKSAVISEPLGGGETLNGSIVPCTQCFRQSLGSCFHSFAVRSQIFTAFGMSALSAGVQPCQMRATRAFFKLSTLFVATIPILYPFCDPLVEAAGMGMPMGTSLSPDLTGLRAAMRKSQSSAVINPPAMAWPLTAATVGRGYLKIRRFVSR